MEKRREKTREPPTGLGGPTKEAARRAQGGGRMGIGKRE